jgi:hypothetical protein
MPPPTRPCGCGQEAITAAVAGVECVFHVASPPYDGPQALLQEVNVREGQVTVGRLRCGHAPECA